MSTKKPLLVVLGATGTQGGSVLSHFLSQSPCPYTLRGMTRDPTSVKAVSLALQGVEMVAGSYDDLSSLDAAFADAAIIYSVTDFWQGFFSPSQREQAAAAGKSIGVFSREVEGQQSRNIIDAAAKIVGSSLERFIFSGLPNLSVLSGGKYAHVFHFDSKAIGEEYGQSAHPELWAKTSVLYAGFYLENYFAATGSLLRPKLGKTRDTLILSVSDPLASAPFPWYSAINDTGPLVQALLLSPPGKQLLGVNEFVSIRDFATILAQVLGKKIEFVDETPSVDMGDVDLEKDLVEMMGWCVEFGWGGEKVDKIVVLPGDLGVSVDLASVREWCGRQDWETVLEVV